MQELTFSQVTSPNGFDEYNDVLRSYNTSESSTHILQLLRKRDTNGKRWYMVVEFSDESPTVTRQEWHVFNVREFRHAENRAERYFTRRKEELGG